MEDLGRLRLVGCGGRRRFGLGCRGDIESWLEQSTRGGTGKVSGCRLARTIHAGARVSPMPGLHLARDADGARERPGRQRSDHPPDGRGRLSGGLRAGRVGRRGEDRARPGMRLARGAAPVRTARCGAHMRCSGCSSARARSHARQVSDMHCFADRRTRVRRRDEDLGAPRREHRAVHISERLARIVAIRSTGRAIGTCFQGGFTHGRGVARAVERTSLSERLA